MTGYSGTPLVKKLGLTEGLVIFVSSPPTGYFDWISPLPPALIVMDKLSGEFDFIHLFVLERKAFIKEFLNAKRHLRKPECCGFPGLKSLLKFRQIWMKTLFGILVCPAV